MGFGSFYKGEKKKKKQAAFGSTGSFAPVFTPPQVISKGKIKESR